MPSDSKTRTRLAAITRDRIFDIIGRECAQCGETTGLEVNHIYGRDYQPKRMSHYNRQRRYLKDALAGEVNALCRECNAAYRPVRRPVEVNAANCPF